MRLLFIHGADGYDEDRTLASAIADELDAELALPRLPDDDMSVAAWSTPIRVALDDLGPGDALVGHSFGGSILLHVLREPGRLRPAVLLGLPDWGPNGWAVPEYALPAALQGDGLRLHHCADDAVVPIAHLDAVHVTLPGSTATTHTSGGHQFDGLAALIAQEAGSPNAP